MAERNASETTACRSPARVQIQIRGRRKDDGDEKEDKREVEKKRVEEQKEDDGEQLHVFEHACT